MTRCPDCCARFDDDEAMREHIERFHDEATLESLDAA